MKYGLLGEKLVHSFSERIHKLYFKYKNLDYSYSLIEKTESELKDFMVELKNGKYDGINVTIPYKNVVMKSLDDVSEKAEKIDAVNTITYSDGKLLGYNTDYFGFLKTLELNNIDVKGKKVIILGTGGSAKAIYRVLLDQGSERVFLASISNNYSFPIKRKDRIIKYMEINSLSNIELIINCTPVGMFPAIDNSPLTDKELVNAKYLIDIIYNPSMTTLMRIYQRRGTKVINGLSMLILQALKAQELWGNGEFDKDIYEKIYNELIERELYK